MQVPIRVIELLSTVEGIAHDSDIGIGSVIEKRRVLDIHLCSIGRAEGEPFPLYVR